MEYLSKTAWYIHIKDAVNCDTEQFSKLWELHEMFDVHQVRMFGKYVNVPRKQGLFSDKDISYKFSGCTVNSFKIPDLQILSECQEKIKHIDTYDAMFFNWYKNGNDYICAHRDDEKGIQPGSSIASISFGATRTFRVREYKTKKIILDIPLTHGSIFVMGGTFQNEFTHEVPKSKKNNDRRINITFRHMC